jgi:hypothetical protein
MNNFETRVRTIDIEATRRYLRGIEQAAREARVSRDLRVVILAMRVLARAGAELGARNQ